MTKTKEIMELVTDFVYANTKDLAQECCDKLEAAIEELVADANRYQWIATYLPSADTIYDDAIVACESKEQLDAVIDAAMEKTP